MRAVQVAQFGDPAVLRVVDLPDPVPGPGQVAIDVTHAAVGLIDVFLRQGVYKDRPGLPRPPFVPGLEVAGTVRELGKGVTGFAVGEHVVTFSATGAGGYASVVVSDQAALRPGRRLRGAARRPRRPEVRRHRRPGRGRGAHAQHRPAGAGRPAPGDRQRQPRAQRPHRPDPVVTGVACATSRP
jgi:Alcohol dehydrogenase GroES-like domain